MSPIVNSSRKMKSAQWHVINAWLRWILLGVAGGIAMRILLAANPLTDASSISFIGWIDIFLSGALMDAAVMSLAFIPIMLFWLSTGHWRFRRPQCFWIMGALAALWAWVTFGMTGLHEFNRGLARAMSWLTAIWFVFFALRSLFPKLRAPWVKAWTIVLLFIYMALFVLDIFGEWLFWDEFGVRYNFIAVDYLVYTNEVVGNIMQSYSMGWIISGVVIAGALLEWALFGGIIRYSPHLCAKGWRIPVSGGGIALAALSLLIVTFVPLWNVGNNVWHKELRANGLISFVNAFYSNSLNYEDFYLLYPGDDLSEEFGESMKSTTDTIVRERIHPNIVLITMESMSADYMHRFGNEDNLTPTLDSLYNRSLAFDNMFAAGNRTVRGLEALTLSRPPSPGESLIKRKSDPGKPRNLSIADLLRLNGYLTRFYYGGNSYFDNMESFFSLHNYDIRDRKTMDQSKVTSQTVWGVCDGDVYDRIIADLDSLKPTDPPVFIHVMTTSNHRPYIYPEGCVAIPPSRKSRKGAVMYSDYALGKFLEKSASHSWNDNTVYVIVADHCASSAGSTELPLENYHIPALIYAPGIIPPTVTGKVSSQVDLMPTLFSLLGWDEDRRLYGRNVLADDFNPRAFVATYQDLGYIWQDTLTVLSPGNKVRQYAVKPSEGNPYALEPVANPSDRQTRRAVSIYMRTGEGPYAD